MSWRLTPLAVVVAIVSIASACASDMKVKKGEPQTAREKMLAEEKANKDAGGEDAKPPGSKKWSGWRYQGDRKDCFFLVGRKCFKTENSACQAAKCKSPARCEAEGGGPATMTCVGGKTDEPADKSKKDDDKSKKDDDKSKTKQDSDKDKDKPTKS